jgi:hypothetical protein
MRISQKTTFRPTCRPLSNRFDLDKHLPGMDAGLFKTNLSRMNTNVKEKGKEKENH